MKEIEVKGQKRNETGKKATRELRKEGFIPCNLYGEKRGENGLPEALAFAVSAAEIRKAVYTPDIYVVNLNIDGELHKAVIKELQFHPVSDQLLHADFYEINAEKPITIGIPVKLNGLAQGVRDGGRLSQAVRSLNVTAPYKHIPELLRELKNQGYKVAIVSNKSMDGVKELKNVYFNGLADAAVGVNDKLNRKPAPDECLEAMKCGKIELNNIVTDNE